MSAADGRDPDAPGARTTREDKKRLTRRALIDAALELFRRQGYEETTIDEIVAAVDVSQRTFFRYFATKEDVVNSVLLDYDTLMEEALAARPAGETPLAALFEALREVLRVIAGAGPDESERFRLVRQVVEANPALAAGHMAHLKRREQALAAVVARRQNVDPDTDLRPQIVVAFHSAATRVAFEDCARHDIWEPAVIAARVEATVALARETMRDWV